VQWTPAGKQQPRPGNTKQAIQPKADRLLPYTGMPMANKIYNVGLHNRSEMPIIKDISQGRLKHHDPSAKQLEPAFIARATFALTDCGSFEKTFSTSPAIRHRIAGLVALS
jgi:hypothetical protein